jgi:hypothetical protein
MLRRKFLSGWAVCAIGRADDPPGVLVVQGAVDYELQPLLDALEGRRSSRFRHGPSRKGESALNKWSFRVRKSPQTTRLQLPSSGLSTTVALA